MGPSLVEDIAMAKFDDNNSDIEFPLVVDGTHLNWPVKDDLYPGQVTLPCLEKITVVNRVEFRLKNVVS